MHYRGMQGGESHQVLGLPLIHILMHPQHAVLGVRQLSGPQSEHEGDAVLVLLVEVISQIVQRFSALRPET